MTPLRKLSIMKKNFNGSESNNKLQKLIQFN